MGFFDFFLNMMPIFGYWGICGTLLFKEIRFKIRLSIAAEVLKKKYIFKSANSLAISILKGRLAHPDARYKKGESRDFTTSR